MSKRIDEMTSKLSQEDKAFLDKSFGDIESKILEYNKIIEKSPICTKIIDLDRKIQYMSCAGITALKIPDITKYYDQPYPPPTLSKELLDLYDDFFPKALKGESVSFECPIPDLEGHEEWYITYLIPIYDTSGEKMEFILASSANISERKCAEFKAERLHRDLLKVSRSAGMADVAAGILHNIGNTLNSMQISMNHLSEKIVHSKTDAIPNIVELIEANQDNLNEFLSNDPKGKKLIPYLKMVSEKIQQENSEILLESERIKKHLNQINKVLQNQRVYAKDEIVVKECALKDIINESIALVGSRYEKHDIALNIQCDSKVKIAVDDHLVSQIVVNLLLNAEDALLESKVSQKEINIEAGIKSDGHFYIHVKDNGVGIAESNVTNIFTNGYTTKEKGDGFGLHNSSKAAISMGGSLSCKSNGRNNGAVFTLDLPT